MSERKQSKEMLQPYIPPTRDTEVRHNFLFSSLSLLLSFLSSFLMCVFCVSLIFIHIYVFIYIVSLDSSGCPRTHYVDQAGLELKRSDCLCLPSIGIKGVHHYYAWLKHSFQASTVCHHCLTSGGLALPF